MPLLISLGRDAEKIDLGSFEAVQLHYDGLTDAAEGTSLARHLSNRWMKPDRREPYLHLEITGPLVIIPGPDQGTILGPYLHLTMIDGTCQVDRRIFGFTDLQARDWYVVDLGTHWKHLEVRFRPSRP